MKLTKAQSEALDNLQRHGGEALKNASPFGGYTFSSGLGRIVGREREIRALTTKGLATIETVGQSTFASITPAGLAALAESTKAETGANGNRPS